MHQYSRRGESDISRKLRPSAMSYSASAEIISFPPNLTGLRVLDIGSGESDCVRRLNESGAYAFGLDIRYRNLATLKEQMDRTVLATSSNVAARYGSEMAAQFRRDTERNRQSFRTFLDKNKRYVSGMAGFLPFDSGTFDFVYSINCIAKGLDEDETIFRQAVSEAFRVLKKDCDLQLWPYLGNNPSPNGRNQELALREYDHTVERLEIPIDYPLRVRIRKS